MSEAEARETWDWGLPMATAVAAGAKYSAEYEARYALIWEHNPEQKAEYEAQKRKWFAKGGSARGATKVGIPVEGKVPTGTLSALDRAELRLCLLCDKALVCGNCQKGLHGACRHSPATCCCDDYNNLCPKHSRTKAASEKRFWALMKRAGRYTPEWDQEDNEEAEQAEIRRLLGHRGDPEIAKLVKDTLALQDEQEAEPEGPPDALAASPTSSNGEGGTKVPPESGEAVKTAPSDSSDTVAPPCMHCGHTGPEHISGDWSKETFLYSGDAVADTMWACRIITCKCQRYQAPKDESNG